MKRSKPASSCPANARLSAGRSASRSRTISLISSRNPLRAMTSSRISAASPTTGSAAEASARAKGASKASSSFSIQVRPIRSPRCSASACMTSTSRRSCQESGVRPESLRRATRCGETVRSRCAVSAASTAIAASRQSSTPVRSTSTRSNCAMLVRRSSTVTVRSSATVTSDTVLTPDSLMSRPCGMPGMMTVAAPG